jgi:hypothetical protein
MHSRDWQELAQAALDADQEQFQSVDLKETAVYFNERADEQRYYESCGLAVKQ